MKRLRAWDTIVIGAGLIGLSLAIELRKHGLRVLVVEKGEPGREASSAAGGMLCDSPFETHPALQELATASAQMYPEFVADLQDESRLKIDLRSAGTVLLTRDVAGPVPRSYPLPRPLPELDPALQISVGTSPDLDVLFLEERCVDPRDVTAAGIAAARNRGVDFSSGETVLAVECADGKASGVRTRNTRFAAGNVINCAGAWAGQIGPSVFPVRPVKGQMLCVEMREKEMLRHVVRAPDVYLIPRSDGRLLIGATVEEAGFDKRTVPATIQRLRQSGIDLVPRLAEARIVEVWAGLRPGTPDKLPILGATSTPGYYVATGHFRDGILLAPVTAKAMVQVISGRIPDWDLTAFSAGRFR